MATQVDERVVRMQFDNAQFEQKMRGTMSLLDKFENQLEFKNASRGLEEVQRAADKVDLSALEDAADSVSVKFDLMSTIVVTQINKMVDAAVSAGERMIKSLSIDQVTAGFDKYTQKTEAVQTIMNATGRSIEDVNNALAKLQWFSDETSYSFVDMTSNVGKFTSAGIDLDVAVSAMQGIANAAADAGANTGQASRAMYNFSQALSKGYVQLIDWKSIENATMSTVTFKQALIDSAVEMGTLTKTETGYLTVKGNELTAAKNFNDTLQDQWLSTEVLLDALGKYSAYSDQIYEVSDAFDTCADAMAATSEEGMELGARAFKAAQQARSFKDAVDATKDAVSSGWMRTFEIIFGNFNESVELWTNFTNSLWDIFASGAEGRNELLKGGLMSGWNQFMETGIKDSEKLKSVLIEIGSAGDENFSKMIEAAGGFEKSLASGWLSADILSQGIDQIVNEIQSLDSAQLRNLGYTQESIDSFIDLKNSVNQGTISLEEFANIMARPSGRENLIASVSAAFHTLTQVIEPLKAALRELFPPVTVEQLYNITVGIKNFCEGLQVSSEAAVTLQAIFKLMLTPVKFFVALIQVGIKWIATFITVIWMCADAVFSFMSQAGAISKVLRTIFGDERYEKLAAAWSKITAKLQVVFDKLGNAISNIGDIVVNQIGPKILKFLQGVWNFISPLVDLILDGIVNAVEWLADFSFEEIYEAIKDFVVELGKQFPWLADIITTCYNAIKDFFEWIQTVTIMDVIYGIRDAFNDAADAIWNFVKSIDFAGIWQKVLDAFEPAIEIFKKIGEAIANFVKRLTPAKVLVFAFGAALVIFLMNISGVAKAVTNLLDVVSGGFKKILSVIKVSPVLQIAAAIVILAGALITLALIDPNRLWNAVGALGALAGGLAALMIINTVVTKFAAKTAESSAAFKTSIASIALMAASIVALALATAALKDIAAEDVLKKVAILTGAIIALEAVTVLISKFSGKFESSMKDMNAMALALLAVAAVFKIVAGLQVDDWAGTIFGFIAIVGALIALSKLCSGVKFSNGAGLISMTLSLLILVGVLKILAHSNVGELLQGVLNMQPLILALLEIAVMLRITGSKAKGTGAAIIAMIAMIYAMIGVINLVADIPGGDILKGIATLGGIALVMAILMSTIKAVDKNQKVARGTTGTILVLAIAIGALSLVVAAIGKLDAVTLGKGLGTVAVLAAIIGIFIKIAKGAVEAKGAIWSLTFLIGVISSAIALLSLIDWTDAAPAALELAVVIAAMGYAMEGMSKTNWKSALTSAALMGLAITAAVLSIKILAKLDTTSSLAAATSLGIVLLALGKSIEMVFDAKLTKARVRNFEQITSELGVAIVIVGVVLAGLSIFGDATKLIAGAVGLGLAMMALAESLVIFSKAGLTKAKVQNFEQIAQELAIAVVVVGLVLAGLSIFGDATKLVAGAVGLGLAMNAIAASIIVLMKAGLTKAKVENVNDVALSMSAFVAVTGAMIGLVSRFGGDAGSIMAASLGLSIGINGVAAAVNVFMKAGLTKAKVENVNKIALSMSVFVIAVGGMLTLLSRYGSDWSSTLSAALGISVCLLAVAAAIKIMDGAEFKKIGDMIGEAVLLMAFLAAITAALIIMGNMDTQNAIVNAVALGVAINAIAFATNLMSGKDMKISEALAMMIALVPLLLATSYALSVIGQIDPASNIANVIALVGLMSAMTALVFVFKEFDIGIKDAFVGAASFVIFMGIIGLVMTAIGALFNKFSGLEAAFTKGCEALQMLFESLTPILLTSLVFMGVLALLGQMGGALLEGVAIGAAAFDLLVVIVGALVLALGGLVELINGTTVLEEGVEAFELIGDAIGGFFGHIVGAFMAGVTSGLPEAAQNVADFVGQVVPALELLGSEQIGKAAENLQTLGTAMLALAGGDVLGALTGERDTLGAFGDELAAFTEPLKTFLSGINELEVDQTKIDNAIAAAKGLADFAGELPKEGGLWQDLAGQSKSITDFANDLVGDGTGTSLASALTSFSATLTLGQFDPDITEKGVESAKLLAGFADNLKKEGGWWQSISGETSSITAFANDLVGTGQGNTSLASALVSFSSTLSEGNFDSDMTTKGAEAAKLLAGFASALPVTGGDWATFAGETESITSFANDLVGTGPGNTSLASALVSFSKTLSEGEFSEDTVEKGVNAATLISDFATNLGSEGGVLEWFSGATVTLGAFGTDLYTFGTGFGHFYESIKDIKYNTVNSALLSLNAAWAFAKKVNGDTDYDYAYGTSLATIGTDMDSFADKLVSFYDKVKNVDTVKCDQVIDVCTALSTAVDAIDASGGISVTNWGTSLAGIADSGLKAFLKKWTGSVTDISAAVKSFMDLFGNLLKVRAEAAFPDVAKAVIETWYTELLGAMNAATGTTEVLTSAISSTINGMSFDLTSLSGSMVTTFGDGLGEYQTALEESVRTTFSSVPMIMSEAIGNSDSANSLAYDAGVKMLTDLAAGAQSQSDETNTSFGDIGSAAAQSFVDGIISIAEDMTELESALNKLSTTVCDEIEEAFGMNQAHSKLWTIGKNIADGLSIGIKDNQATPANASIKMAENLLKVIQDYLDIHSPSRVMRDEVGAYIVQGIADGITSDMSAEEAAKKKAENILSAFKDSVAALENDDSVADLEYKLWEGTHQDASDEEKANQKAQMYEKQLITQGQRVDAAAAAWGATIDQFGRNSEEAQDAYVEYLQAQNTLMDLANNAAELDKALSDTEDDEDALKSYNEYFLAHYNDIEEGLKTEQELWEEAARATGYGQKKADSNKYFGTDVKSIMDRYVSKNIKVVTESAEEIQRQIYENDKAKAAQGTTSGISDGISEALSSFAGVDMASLGDFNIGAITEEIEQAVSGGVLGGLDFANMNWKDLFSEFLNFGDGSIASWIGNIGDGLNGIVVKGADAAKGLADQFIAWIRKKFDINSPSKVMEEIGEYLIAGLIQGLNSKTGAMETSLEYMVQSLLSATDEMGGSLTDVMTEENLNSLKSALDLAIQQAVQFIENSEIGQPVIRPVLDLSAIQQGLASLDLSSMAKISGVAAGVSSDFSSRAEAMSRLQNGSGNAQPVVNYNFNQTNNSPKPLNPSIVYRQSRNLFSQLKLRNV